MFRTLPLGLTAVLAATVLAQGSLSAEAARGSGMGPGKVQFTHLHIPAKPSAAPSKWDKPKCGKLACKIKQRHKHWP
jgi:hypothetical protein